MEYRREIDGLRAVAVLPVMLFHAGSETFRGGFVGVDVFFVISGYLITTIILKELHEERFSLVNFYERRARRIMPALFVVMLACVPFAWLWLLPSDMKSFSQSLAAVSVFASNILFWRQRGYFAAADEGKPLLHTWSLAVEEQYYVLFPLFLLLLWRMKKERIVHALAVVFIASLAVAQWGSLERPTPAFFLLPTRGWELVLGAFASLYLFDADRAGLARSAREAGGWLGLALIGYSVLTYSQETPFPGLYALAPTIGALLVVLFATKETAVGQFLGNRVFVGIGLVSYSAYLWHQPLFAFAHHRSLAEPNDLMLALLGGIAFLLAYVTWRYVERPFRDRSMFERSTIFRGALLASSFFGVFGLVGHFTDGAYAARPSIRRAADLDLRIAINNGLSEECKGEFNNSINCRTDEEPEVLVWGDSYAMHLVQGFIASNPDVRLVQKTISVCGPILDIAPIDARHVRSWSENCMENNDRVLEFIKNTPSIVYVVMSSPLDQYVGDGAMVMTRDGSVVPGSSVALQAMGSTIARIKDLGKAPVVFSPTPENGHDLGRCSVKAALFDADPTVCELRLSESYVRHAAVYGLLRELERDTPVVWLQDGLCEGDVCRASADGVFVYRDSGHLSHEGSAYLGKKMGFYELLRQSPIPVVQ